MAYMSQEHKQRIHKELKAIMPIGWKWSLSVNHHSTLVFTIAKAPMDLISICNDIQKEWHIDRNARLGWKDEFQPSTHFDISRWEADKFPSEFKELFMNIQQALNLDNFDNSDSQTDYFHVGHYVRFNIGRWDKPFTYAPIGETA